MHSDHIQVSSRSPERGSTPANNLSSSLNFPERSSPPYDAIFRTVEERDQFPGNVTGFRIYDTVSYSFHILDFNLLNVYLSEMQESSTIPSPDNLVEAHLLLEMAISNCRVQHIQKTLADQLVHRNELQLQYSRLQVDKAMSKLTTAELHVGRVPMIVRRSGYSPDSSKLYTPST